MVINCPKGGVVSHVILFTNRISYSALWYHCWQNLLSQSWSCNSFYVVMIRYFSMLRFFLCCRGVLVDSKYPVLLVDQLIGMRGNAWCILVAHWTRVTWVILTHRVCWEEASLCSSFLVHIHLIRYGWYYVSLRALLDDHGCKLDFMYRMLGCIEGTETVEVAPQTRTLALSP